MSKHVKFVGLAIDNKMVASHLNWDKEAKEDYEGVMRQIFGSSGWDAVLREKKTKLELKSNTNVYCIELDAAKRVYVAVVTEKYPTRYIFSSSSGVSASPRLMQELRDHVSALVAANGGPASGSSSISSPESGKSLFKSKGLKTFLKTLASKFDDVDGIDKIAAAARRVQDVQRIMADNINQASERDGLLAGIDDKSKKLNQSAKSMFESSTALKRKSCCRKWMAYTIVTSIFLFAAAAIILGLNYGQYHWWD